MKILYNEEEDAKYIEDQPIVFILTTFKFLDKIREIMNINEKKINQPTPKKKGQSTNQHGWQGKEIKKGNNMPSRQEMLCLFFKWNGHVLCCILATLISSNTFFM